MALSRRTLLASVPAALAAQSTADDWRKQVVARHNPELRGLDPRSPLSVGNGEFAFTMDPTGLQTFPQPYETQLPLCTQSQWAWHTTPNPTGQGPADYRLTGYDTFGRQVGYPAAPAGQRQLYDWLRENPHRLHLGRIGFAIASQQDVRFVRQTLDLWTGVLHSEFEYQGRKVVVETCCHPTLDAIAVRIQGRLPVVFEFPYGSPLMHAADFAHPERHQTTKAGSSASSLQLRRQLDADTYTVSIAWPDTAATIHQESAHRFVLTPASDQLAFSCQFQRGGKERAPRPAAAFTESARHWSAFWNSGAAIELSAPDPRARELERRIVLSQYLTAIQCAGSLPPQETGLTCNSWYGKYHLEMHYWHAAHFPKWGRPALLERSLGWYAAILPSARETAKQQGYTGARWPKMTAADGRGSPGDINPFLIWQQPHPILMAELIYASQPTAQMLARYREIVFASAEFMASYAHYDAANSRYVLGPPVIPAQESHPPRETWNPTYELEYWDYGLAIAQRWRQRAGLGPEPKWDEIRAKLSPLSVKDGVYLAHENCPQTFTERNRDHPSMLAALGVLPGRKVDRETMRRTLKKVFAEWKWEDTWGWDYPMVAMTAASLQEPELAIDALAMVTPKNTWLPNGHNWQRASLPLYLPGNGGLLLAIAHMAREKAFPATWKVRAEGFPQGV
ncbi:MAG: glycoside hydrolase family 65 [Candidatus Solibacter sp.]